MAAAPTEGHTKVFVGNLDPRMTEHIVFNLFQKIGKVRDIQYLWHQTGPHKGQPRGYCFVEYHTQKDAEMAIQKLNGKKVSPLLQRPLIVSFAHQRDDTFDDHSSGKRQTPPANPHPESSSRLSALVIPKQVSTDLKISLLETKIKRLERSNDSCTPSSTNLTDTTDSENDLPSSKRSSSAQRFHPYSNATRKEDKP